MREMIEKVKGAFAQRGYRKRGNSFYKIEDGFYRLVSFQKGAFGNYFYINLGLHPVGLPILQANALLVPDRPKEYECALRVRIDKAVSEENRDIWSKAQNWIGDDMVPHIIDAISDIDAWFKKCGSFNAILNCPFDEMTKMLTAVPILWEKEYLMLKFYCAYKVGNFEEAQRLFSKYSGTAVKNLSFEGIDSYLRSMLT